MKKNKVLILILFAFLTPILHAVRLPDSIIRVAVEENADKVNIGCEGDYYYCDLETGDKFLLSDKDIYLVKPIKNGILVGDKEVAANELRFTPETANQCVRIEGKRYRDSVTIRKTKTGKLTVINELGLESYIAGVLTREVDPAWPMESLKAQAVVSRTFTLSNLERHKSEGYSLCNKVHCQVYGGIDGENARTNKAIEETRGQVLVYNGYLINAVFHSCCAGYTEDVRNVWENDCKTVKYLTAVKCKFCRDCPQYYWSKNVDESYLRKKLVARGYTGIAEITGIYFKDKTKSGRSKTIRIKYISKKDKTSEFNISSAKFRLFVDPWTIKSTKISSIKRINDTTFKFTGNGWGHGVGMCQWGAKGMADKGYDYKEIVVHYYPSTKIEKWEE